MESQMQNHNLLQSLKHTCITTLKTQTPHISCLALHNSLLYAATVNEINVFDLSNYILIDTFGTKSHISSGSVKSIAFNNSRIFTSHQDCKIRAWKITPSKEHHLVSTLPTVKDRLFHFMLPSSYVDVRRHKKKLWIEHWDTVSGLAVNGDLMYSVSWDKCFKTWSIKSNKCLESVVAHDDAVNTVIVSDDGVVYTGSADGLIRVWERVSSEGRRKHSLISTLKKHKSAVNALALDGNGSTLFSGSCDSSILVWERNKNHDNQIAMVEALWGHRGAILCLGFVAHNKLISGSSDRMVRIWEIHGKIDRSSCIVVLEGHESPVKSLAATRRGEANESFLIFSGSLDGEIKVWEVSDDEIQREDNEVLIN